MAATVFSLVKKGDIYRLSYLASGETTGLTNITAKVFKPDGTAGTTIPWNGTNPLLGFVEAVNGWYYTDIDTTSLDEGAWHYIVDSTTRKSPAATRIQVVNGNTFNDTVFENLMTNISTVLANVQDVSSGLPAINVKLDDIKGVGFDTTDDSLDAIRNAINAYIGSGGTIPSLINALSVDISGVQTVVDGIQTDLDNPTDGLSALKTLIDAIQADIDNGTTGLGAIKTAVDGNYNLLVDSGYGLNAIKTAVDLIISSGVTADLSSIKGVGYVEADNSLKAISDRQFGGIAF